MKLPVIDTPQKKVAALAMLLATIAVPLFSLAPHFALAIGLAIGLSVGNSLVIITRPVSKYLLQACVVGLGFGMNFLVVTRAGKEGFVFTIITIAGALLIGILLGKLLRVGKRISYLISAGTAICGGSAIAAISPVVKADEKEMSVAMGTVFALNAIALFIFPIIGRQLHLSDTQFGIWCAVAIHDTSSVVGAASAFGEEALMIATTVKLARALWILPLTIITALIFGRKAGIRSFPVFILLFVVASLINTYAGLSPEISKTIVVASKHGMSLTLLFIGSAISPASLRQVGIRALSTGLILWLILLVSALVAVMFLV